MLDSLFAGHRPGLDLRYLAALLRSNLALIVAILAAALGVAVAATLLTTPRFTATATIQINDSSSRVLGDKDGEPADAADNFGYDTDRFLQTEVDILRSRGLAIRVAQKLGLAGSARFFAAQQVDLPAAGTAPLALRNAVVGMLLGHLNVTLPRDSRIVTIQYDSTDPEISADITNAYAGEFIQANLQRRYDSSSYARDFVSGQLAETKQKLEDSERALNDYARQAELIHTEGALPADKSGGQNSSSVTTESLVELNQAANEATAKRIAAQGRWQAISSGPLLGAPEVVNNPTISSLLSQRAAIEAQLQEEQARHLDAYPAVRAKQEELAGIKQQIQAVAGNIRESVKADYAAARNSEEQLTGEVSRLKGATLSEQDRNVQYGLLQREVDTNREVYDGLLQRYKELNAAAGISLSNISVIDSADPPASPSSPNLVKNLAMALVVGAALVVATLFIKDQFDDAIRVPEDIEGKLGLPLLGIVPQNRRTDPAEALADPKSPMAEAYNSLRGTLMYATTDGLPQVMLVTSAQPAEGKTITSLALAQGFARMGKRVVLFDADLRRPMLHRHIGYDNARGLSTLLTQREPLAQVVQPSGMEMLALVPSGPVPASPTELVSSPRLEAVLQEAALSYDVVIIDSPPVLGLADAPMIAALVDGVIFVVEAERGRRGALKTALRRLKAMRPVLLGAVLTKFDPAKAGNRYSEYAGYDFYRYDAPAQDE
ncbi:MAG: polysaccharide biosynthesis tyrosine autokinase [Sphingomonadales bacterium]|nr:polysaccharide biosynthesis tyrosine autokinase [Sphingomonadales bacterium]